MFVRDLVMMNQHVLSIPMLCSKLSLSAKNLNEHVFSIESEKLS